MKKVVNINNVKILYFFTYDYTLKLWKDSGNLDREMEYFTFLNQKYNISFTFITYGDKNDLEILENTNFIEVLPIYGHIKKCENKFLRYIYSFRIPFLIKKKAKNFDIIKQNQLLGSWISIIFKLITRKPLMTRTGYDMYTFSRYEQKSTLVRCLYYILTQLTLLFSNIYTVSSEVDRKFLHNHFINTKKKLTLIPNWVGYEKTNEIIPRYSNKVLAIGRLEFQKNFSFLISSLKDSEIEIDLYGDGALKADLQLLAIENNVKINFLGVLPYSDLIKVYKEYKIFISTSFYEGNPKTILEAMSQGCIVIASSIENNKEIITDNVNGILFEFTDNLSNIVHNLLLNNIKANNISKNARSSVIENNSIEYVSKLEVDTFNKMTS